MIPSRKSGGDISREEYDALISRTRQLEPLQYTIDGPSSTKDIALWLRADTIAGGDAAPVSSWNDIIHQELIATQAIANQKPVKRLGGSGGQSYVKFSGGQMLSMPFNKLAEHDAATFIFVVKSSGIESVIAELGPNANTIPGGFGFFYDGNGNFNLVNNIVGSNSIAAALVAHNNTPQIVRGSMKFKRFPVTNLIGGIQIGNNPAPSFEVFKSNNLNLGNRVNASLYVTADVYEIIIFNRLLSDEELESMLLNYLKPRYAL